MKPLCFIIMPFGKKPDAQGNIIDFDYVYNEFIKRVIDTAGLEPIRADEEMIGGIIHKPMYERLVLCDYAIADLTTANANVFYELGIRYTAKPFTTFSIFESGTKIPFDVRDTRCFPYTLQDGRVKDAEQKITDLVTYIEGLSEERATDSPIYQLLDGIQFSHSLSDKKVDMLRQQNEKTEQLRSEIAQVLDGKASPQEKLVALKHIEAKLGNKRKLEIAACVDLMLAYRSLKSHNEMVVFIESLPRFVKQTTMVQEQYGFALNRAKRHDEAIRVLQKLIDTYGPSSETCGILGRVYKDKYDEAKETNAFKAAGFLNKSIETYLAGYKSDMRDFYPGVNAVNLLSVKKDPSASDLATVVEFSVITHLDRKAKKSSANLASTYEDYWPYATLVELAVIQDKQQKAFGYLEKCLTMPSESWQRESTTDNLKRFADEKIWVKDIIEALTIPE